MMTSLTQRSVRRPAAIVAIGLLAAAACNTTPRDYGEQEGSAGASSGGTVTGGAESGGTQSGGGAGGTSPETGGQGGETSDEVEAASCTKDEDCLSGSCRLSYRDRDGDGYGDDDDVTGRCDGTIPAGYTTFGGDCCDDGGNLELAALIHPAQAEYFDSPANICGISWDYNCNGQLDFGGYTCSTLDQAAACADPAQRNYETAHATATSRYTGCAPAVSCATGCDAQVVDLAEADCGSHYHLVGCGCAGGCGQGGCTSCSTTAGNTRRVVQCR